MRTFVYKEVPNELLSSRMMNMVGLLHEHKGRQELYVEQEADKLEALCEVAKIQSTDASNRIEGIFTTDGRLKALMSEGAAPRTRAEQEIAGYRDVLALIHESYDAIDVTPNVILQLHKMLYRHTSYSFGGHWKDSDNAIVEVDEQGRQRVRFKPLPARAVPDAMEELCQAYNRAIATQDIDPLILAALFTFDFICIHPFNDGNGRMSRLLTLLLLYRSGYLVGKYISIEREIERSKETYYEVLQACSPGWDMGENTYAPFVEYLLGCFLGAYRMFEERVKGIVRTKMSMPERLEAVLQESLAPLSRSELSAACPDISDVTVARTLSQLLHAGKIEKLGAGRATKYRWVR